MDPLVSPLPCLGQWIEIGFADSVSPAGYGKDESGSSQDSSPRDEWSDGESDPSSFSLYSPTVAFSSGQSPLSQQSPQTGQSSHPSAVQSPRPSTINSQLPSTVNSQLPSAVQSPLSHHSLLSAHSPPTLHLDATATEEASLLRSYQLPASPTLLASPTTRRCIPKRAAVPRSDLTERAQRQQMQERAGQLCAVLALRHNCVVDGLFTVAAPSAAHA